MIVALFTQGICFGHQIIARALGKDCVPNGGRWEVGPTKLDLTDVGKQVFGTDTLVRLFLYSINILNVHLIRHVCAEH